ncbi:cell wall beta-glucan synthesis [Fusarium denticulatum]|uniref:Cell wall beta-glucan synthesis n=1 Tax=Fusarium denticulatum TaxID=48507 RepID=A0A8H5UJ75_9HYPO|nr:cell wall beta-glucan synthesis [Fusarium denticulatum]
MVSNFISFLFIFSFIAGVIAQTPDFAVIFSPTAWQEINAGDLLNVGWNVPGKYAGQKVDIFLIGGASQGTQVPIMNIASGIDIDVDHYDWRVDSSLGADNVYGLQMKLQSNPSIFQYSNPFKIIAKPHTTTSAQQSSSKDKTAAPSPTRSATTTLSAITTAPVDGHSSSFVITYSAPGATTSCDTYHSNSLNDSQHANTYAPPYATPTAPIVVAASGPTHAAPYEVLLYIDVAIAMTKVSSLRTITDIYTRGQTSHRFFPPSSKRTSPDSAEVRSSPKRQEDGRGITTAAQMDEETINQTIIDTPARGGGWYMFQCLEHVFPLDGLHVVHASKSPLWLRRIKSSLSTSTALIPPRHAITRTHCWCENSVDASICEGTHVKGLVRQVEAFRLAKNDAENKIEHANLRKPGEHLEIMTQI